MTAGRLKVWNAGAGEWEYVNAPAGGGSLPFVRKTLTFETILVPGSAQVTELAITGGVPTEGTLQMRSVDDSDLNRPTLNWNDDAAAAQATADAEWGPGRVVVTGGPLPATPLVFTFAGALGTRQMTFEAASQSLDAGVAGFTNTTPGVNKIYGVELWTPGADFLAGLVLYTLWTPFDVADDNSSIADAKLFFKQGGDYIYGNGPTGADIPDSRAVESDITPYRMSLTNSYKSAPIALFPISTDPVYAIVLNDQGARTPIGKDDNDFAALAGRGEIRFAVQAIDAS